MSADEPNRPPGEEGGPPAKPQATPAGTIDKPNTNEGDPLAFATPSGTDGKPAEGAKADGGVEAAKPADAPPAEKPKQRRGFAAMDRAKVRAIAMLGGAAVHRKGTAHRFSREEAREAGRKGGLAPHRVRGRKLPPEEPGSSKNPNEEG